MKRILLLTFAFLCAVWGLAQEQQTVSLLQRSEHTDAATPADDLPVLSLLYYQDSHFLSHDYNYELRNKQRKLRRMATDISIMGSSVIAGISFAGGFLANNLGWKEGVYIPAATVVSVGLMLTCLSWSSHLNSKADALERATTAYVLPLTSNSDVGLSHVTCDMNNKEHFWGIGFRTSF